MANPFFECLHDIFRLPNCMPMNQTVSCLELSRSYEALTKTSISRTVAVFTMT
uniref:Uncharacterized protein n=1 Tax=Arundo donax TaxID=35708 RepID=A0A0A8ZHY5_ARUDO